MTELKLEQSLIDDRYEVLERKGQGSYAEIFTARDRLLNGETVIIKALNSSLQGTPDAELEQTLLENFHNEAIALDAVRHANIIRRLGDGKSYDRNGLQFHYLVLEYMPGGDLLQRCRRQRLSFDEMLDYMRQVCDALSYAHKCNVIHRDIKPNNLLLSADGSIVKIADFGVAKVSPQANEEVTRVGTDIYAPPEHHPQLSTGEFVAPMLTPSADIYSLAKTIYTLLSGHAPRQFKQRAIAQMPPEIEPEPWAEALLATLQRATDAQIDKRYLTVAAFYHDLKNVPALADEVTRVRARGHAHSANANIDNGGEVENNAALPSPAHEQARIVVPLMPRPPATKVEERPSSLPPSLSPSLPPSLSRNGGAQPVNGANLTTPDRPASNGNLKSGAPAPSAEYIPKTDKVKVARRGFWERADEFVVKRRMQLLTTWALLLFLVFSVWVYHITYQLSNEIFQPHIAVILKDVTVRSAPTTNSTSLGYLRSGAKLHVIKHSQNNWYLVEILDATDIKTANTDHGWVYGDFIKLPPDAASDQQEE